ncbi:MAG TPA: phosphatase PAP2 family protein [Mycobacteriales bacterium]|nr:phosphatase PAP2 family protein [Mycobacteriales bacterium]
MTQPDKTAAKDDRTLIRPLLIAAAVAAILAVTAYLLIVRTRLGQRFDNAALVGSLQQSDTSRLHDASFLGHITTKSFAAALIGMVLIGLARRRPRLGVTVAATALVGLLGIDFIKDHVLTRPFLVASDATRTANTFPSGHTAIAIGGAFALVVLSPPLIRGVVAILAGAYSWAVAADVQSAGWHRPSDAIGSVLICFALICVAVVVLARFRPRSEGRRLTHVPAYVVLGAVLVFSLSLSIYNAVRVLHALRVSADAVTFTHSVLNAAYLFSINLTVAMVVFALISLLVLLGPFDFDAPYASRKTLASRPEPPEELAPSTSSAP